MSSAATFWSGIDALVRAHPIVIDRPAGSPHPTSPEHLYPLDYGYLDGTRSSDGEAVDVWVGTMPSTSVVGVLCTVDGLKREVEAKILVGCSSADVAAIQEFFVRLKVGCLVLPRPTE